MIITKKYLTALFVGVCTIHGAMSMSLEEIFTIVYENRSSNAKYQKSRQSEQVAANKSKLEQLSERSEHIHKDHQAQKAKL